MSGVQTYTGTKINEVALARLDQAPAEKLFYAEYWICDQHGLEMNTPRFATYEVALGFLLGLQHADFAKYSRCTVELFP